MAGLAGAWPSRPYAPRSSCRDEKADRRVRIPGAACQHHEKENVASEMGAALSG